MQILDENDMDNVRIKINKAIQKLPNYENSYDN